jgi:hypothetical protein
MNDKLTILFEQYKRIGDYSINTANSIKNNILTYGFGIIGAVLAGNIILLNSGKYLSVVLGIFLFILPIVTLTILFIWIGEVHRMVRAGLYLLKLEKQINEILKENILNWESFIREKEKTIKYPDFLSISILIGISFFSIIAAIALSHEEGIYLPDAIIIVSDITIHLIVVYLIVRIIHRFRKLTFDQLLKPSSLTN